MLSCNSMLVCALGRFLENLTLPLSLPLSPRVFSGWGSSVTPMPSTCRGTCGAFSNQHLKRRCLFKDWWDAAVHHIESPEGQGAFPCPQHPPPLSVLAPHPFSDGKITDLRSALMASGCQPFHCLPS